MCVCMYVYMCVCMYVYMCVCMCVCVCVCMFYDGWLKGGLGLCSKRDIQQKAFVPLKFFVLAFL